MVINRISKGIKYLYDLNHHHLKISAEAITWPTDSKQTIQLIDEWALKDEHDLKKIKLYKPKDEEDRE